MSVVWALPENLHHYCALPQAHAWSTSKHVAIKSPRVGTRQPLRQLAFDTMSDGCGFVSPMSIVDDLPGRLSAISVLRECGST